MATLPDSLTDIGSHRFDDHQLKSSVSSETYSEFHACLASGDALTKSSANEVAQALTPTWTQAYKRQGGSLMHHFEFSH